MCCCRFAPPPRVLSNGIVAVRTPPGGFGPTASSFSAIGHSRRRAHSCAALLAASATRATAGGELSNQAEQ
tara:strand:+ start:286 stop:498 length:213 start_codon:yes stop_codon:yes gene_type:complete